MEQQIRDLCRGLDNVNVVQVDSASSTNIQQIIDRARLPISVPTLGCHHSPFGSGKLDTLEDITFDRLHEHHRRTGKVLHITVTEVKYQHGILIHGKDQNGTQGVVWCLLLRPFGKPITAGMKLAIKEPYYGFCPAGDLAVCLHHAIDCVLDVAPESEIESASSWPPTCSKNAIAVRPSSLGGRGVFAVMPISMGSLVILEKALALSTDADAAAYGPGIEGILEGERTNGRKLALLQQLEDRMSGNAELRREFFDLYAGEAWSNPVQKFSRPDNTYCALSIIKYNSHTIFPGNTSDHHDIANNKSRNTNLTPNDQTPGIWLTASMFNHSCLPNCAWAWTGDLFVARANRDITEGEELTVAYVPSSYDYEKRNGVLKASNDFECHCPLCKADEAATRTPEMQEAVNKAQRLPQHVKGSTLKERINSAEDLVSLAVNAYPRSTYTDEDGIELPCIQLAEPFYHLAHIVLDLAKNGFNWKATSQATREKARKYFLACVEVGLGYKLVLDPSSSYCELLFLKHSQPRPIGVLSLVALAELAFLDGEKERCKALKYWAKKLYGIWYGEDASFKKHHLYYSCKDEPAEKGKASASKEWEELKKEKMGESKMAPKFE